MTGQFIAFRCDKQTYFKVMCLQYSEALFNGQITFNEIKLLVDKEFGERLIEEVKA